MDSPGCSPQSPERTGRKQEAAKPLGALVKGQDDGSRSVVRQLAVWERELEEIEKKGGELMTGQWKLMREQMGTVMEGFAEMQGQLAELRRASTQGVAKVRSEVNEAEHKLQSMVAQQERALRAEWRVELEGVQGSLREGLRSEASARESVAGCAAAGLAAALEACKQEYATKEDFACLTRATDAIHQQLKALQVALEREMNERRHADDYCTDQLRLLREEARDCDAAHRETARGLREAASRQASEQACALQELQGQVDGLGAEFAGPCNEVLDQLRGRCRDLGEELGSRLADQQKALEKVASDKAHAHAKLEQRVTELCNKLDGEGTARKLMGQDLDRALAACRERLRGVVAEEAEASRRAMENVEAELGRRVEQEQLAREAEISAAQTALRAEKSASEREMGELRRRMDELEAHAAADGRLKELESNQKNKVEDLMKQISELKGLQRDDVFEARKAMEADLAAHEERQRTLLDGVLRDLGRRLLDNGVRRTGRSQSPVPSVQDSSRSWHAPLPPVSTVLPASASGCRDAISRPQLQVAAEAGRQQQPRPQVPPLCLPERPRLTGSPVDAPASSSRAALGQAPWSASSAAPLGQVTERAQAVIVSGHTARRNANGVYKPLTRRYMDAPVYYCRDANTYLFRSARNGSWGIGDKPSGGLIAHIQSASPTAAAIAGTWKVLSEQGHGWVLEPRLTLVPHSRAEDSLRDSSVIVKSHFADITGCYSKTADLRQGAPIYVNEAACKSLWFSGQDWRISRAPGSEACLARSLDTSAATRPDAVEWHGAEVVSPEADDPEAEEEEEEEEDSDDGRRETPEISGFSDKDFGPDERSLGARAYELGIRDDSGVQWVRAASLQLAAGSAPQEAAWRLHPGFLASGAQGNCWLLAAVAAIAEFPGYLCATVFKHHMLSRIGRYTLSLYDVGPAEWVDVTVDDFIPCRPRQWYEKKPKPCFSQPACNEMQVLILEKAFAKCAGSYWEAARSSATTGPAFAWQALTGVSRQLRWRCRNNGGAWMREEMLAGELRGLRRQVGAGSGSGSSRPPQEDAEKGYDEMFMHFAKCSAANFLMGAAIPQSMESERRPDGLIDTYVYPLLGCKEVEGFRLLLLRNIWGVAHQWNGAWSAGSPLWASNPNVFPKLQAAFDGLEGGAAGGCGPSPGCSVFVMAWEDFAAVFKDVYVSPKDMGFPRVTRNRDARKVVGQVLQSIALKIRHS